MILRKLQLKVEVTVCIILKITLSQSEAGNGQIMSVYAPMTAAAEKGRQGMKEFRDTLNDCVGEVQDDAKL